MTRRTSSFRRTLRQARRVAHFTQRTIGDAEATVDGRLPKRLVRRWATRRLMRVWDRLWT
jgi:hypothetical protein